MVSDGSSSFRNTPSVELIMPAPMRTTSGSVVGIFGIECLLQSYGAVCFFFASLRSGRRRLQLANAKRHRGSWSKNNVGAAPGRVVGQLPTVSGADRVLGKPHAAGLGTGVHAPPR